MKINLTLDNIFIDYPNLIEPETREGGVERFTAMLSMPADSVQAKTLERAVVRVSEAEWGADAEFKSPLRLGDDRLDDGFKGRTYVNAATKFKPRVYDRAARVCDDAETQRLIKPGAKVNAVISLYPYDVDGTKGVGVRFSAVQWVAAAPKTAPFRDLDAPDEIPF